MKVTGKANFHNVYPALLMPKKLLFDSWLFYKKKVRIIDKLCVFTSTCQQKVEKHMPTYNHGTFIPTNTYILDNRGVW